MPFASDKQRKLMFAKHPQIARKWVAEAKKKGEPVTKSAWGVDHAEDISKGIGAISRGAQNAFIRGNAAGSRAAAGAKPGILKPLVQGKGRPGQYKAGFGQGQKFAGPR